MKNKVLITGLTRQSSKYIKEQILDIEKKISPFFDIHFFVVESDSKDETVKRLSELKATQSNFNFITLGDLESDYPNRFSRLRKCRNKYVEYFKKEKLKFGWDLVFVMDLDKANNSLQGKNIHNSLNRIQEWDVITANQLFGYYDLIALRCTDWCENDIFDELKSKKSRLKLQGNQILRFLTEDNLRRKIIYKRMRIIPAWKSEIEVSSAFGGFGIYKAWIFEKCDYGSEDVDRCEHLELNRKIKEQGGRIFILPSLINCIGNEYILNKLFLIRLMRFLVNYHRKRV